MTWSTVVEFPTVDATAAVKAAWIAAAEAEGDWWDTGLDEPRLEGLVEPSPGQALAALAANRVNNSAGSHVPAAAAAAAAADPVWADPEPGPVPAGLAGWVRAEWWHGSMRDGVRVLLTMAPGAELVAALAGLGAQSPCPADHGHPDPVVEAADPMPAPGSSPGFPCVCQVIVTAGWEAVESWVQVQGAAALVAAAGAGPVKATPAGFARAQATDPARVEVAPALRLAPRSVPGRVHTARDLHAFPDLAVLAGDGTLFAAAWRAVLGETVNLSESARARVIGHMVEVFVRRRAQDRRPWTPAETRKAVRVVMHTLARDELEQARQEAMKGRRACLTPDSDGMTWLNALLPEVDAHRVYNRLTAAAAAAKVDDPDDDRTADQRRADLLIALLLGSTNRDGNNAAGGGGGGDDDGADGAAVGGDGDGGSGGYCDAHQPGTRDGEGVPEPTVGPGADSSGPHSPDDPPDPHGGHVDPHGVNGHGTGGLAGPAAGAGAGGRSRAPQGTGPVPITGPADICVVATLTTLLGLAQDPAHVPGLGPVGAEVARQLAADGRWRLWITDPSTGHITATGSRTYTPSAGLARLIRAREPTCRMPGCARQAASCDLDHTVPYPGEPGTIAANLGPLCRGDHNLKTHRGYHLENLPPEDPDPGGHTPPRWRWTFPSGLTHTDQPDPPLAPP